MVTGTSYAGRFAPSPTGPLHFGSLVTALASYLEARQRRGQWFLRIEDVDFTRCGPHWTTEILETLTAFGFEWDGEVVYQSSASRQQAYAAALNRLQSTGLLYPCLCSRKQLAQGGNPEICHCSGDAFAAPAAWRIRFPSDDFVLRRADGAYCYQLAVVVDDTAQGVTHVVRGADLLSSTPRQVFLQQQLGLPPVTYLHLPVVENGTGAKLSKQTGAAPLQRDAPVDPLCEALRFLKQKPPDDLRKESLAAVWKWALANWNATCYTVQS